MVVYGLLCAALLGISGLLLRAAARWTPLRLSRRAFLSILLGVAMAFTVATIGSNRLLAEEGAGLPLAIALAVVVGSLIAVLTNLVMRRWQRLRLGKSVIRRSTLRGAALLLFFLPLVAVLAVGLYRGARNLPLFHPASPRTTAQRPNIVFIVVDALRADHLGAYGYDPRISPHLDALAQQGVLFQEAHAQSSWTLPSVASFITSLYPSELQVQCRQDLSVCYHRIDEMRTTMAEVMHEAGYETYAYLTNPWLQPADGFLQGVDHFSFIWGNAPFDRSFLMERPLLRSVLHIVPPLQPAFEEGYSLLFDPRLSTGNRGELINYHALRALRQHPREPFFLWLHYMEPHTPYNPDRPFRPISPEITPQQEQSLRELGFLPTLGASSPENAPSLNLTTEEHEALVSLYDGSIAEVDQLIGEILTVLDREGLRERTMVVVTADHGEEFCDHGGYSHGQTMYRETIRVPLIINGPMITVPGQTVETPVRLLDLLPTLAEAIGQPVPSEARGESLLSLLQGEDLEGQPIYSEYTYQPPYDLRAVLYRGYKLIYCPSRQQAELYNVVQDPTEQFDLAQREPASVDEMMTLLEEWMERTALAAETLPRAAPPETVDQDSLREQLEELGY